MARIRTIKPELPQSESMGRVSRDARLCFILLWTLADDEGRLRGNSRMLASLLFPYDDDAKDLIQGWLNELSKEGCIVAYTHESDSYVQIHKWLKHQKIDKPSPSKIPAPLIDSDSPRDDSRILPVGSKDLDLGSGPKDLGPEDQGEDLPEKPSARKRSIPDNFTASPAVLKWAVEQGYSSAYVGSNLTTFVLSAQAKGYKYATWDKALMNAIRANWAKVGNGEASKHNGFDSVDYRKGVSDDGSF